MSTLGGTFCDETPNWNAISLEIANSRRFSLSISPIWWRILPIPGVQSWANQQMVISTITLGRIPTMKELQIGSLIKSKHGKSVWIVSGKVSGMWQVRRLFGYCQCGLRPMTLYNPLVYFELMWSIRTFGFSHDLLRLFSNNMRFRHCTHDSQFCQVLFG